MTEVNNKQAICKGYVGRTPAETEMEITVNKIKLEAPIGSGALLVKNLFLSSCDPYMRGRMRYGDDPYSPLFVPGQPLEGFGVSRVINSDNPNFKPGDLVSGITGWEKYSLIHKTEQLRKIQPDDDIALSYQVGLLGIPGFTSDAGFFEVCTPKNGEYVFVSAASSDVGQLVGQLAKLRGCYVVGSDSTSQKIDLLKNKLGFDEAFNYKEEKDLDAALKRYFPQGIDIYIDNVGGEMLDAALLNMRTNGRVAVCGVVSQQDFSKKTRGIYNWLITKHIRVLGFLQHDYLHSFPSFLEHVIFYYKHGKIVCQKCAPAAFVG